MTSVTLTYKDGEGWTDERKAVTEAMWGDGYSARQIAIKIGGGLSRNAVIGMVHRRGWVARATASSPSANRKFRPGAEAPRAKSGPRPRIAKPVRATFKIRSSAGGAEPPRPLVLVAHHTDAPGKTLADLRPFGECRAPRRDSNPAPGRMAGMLYCAEPIPAGEVYCGKCLRWMFTKPRSAAQKAVDEERVRAMREGKAKKAMAA